MENGRNGMAREMVDFNSFLTRGYTTEVISINSPGAFEAPETRILTDKTIKDLDLPTRWWFGAFPVGLYPSKYSYHHRA